MWTLRTNNSLCIHTRISYLCVLRQFPSIVWKSSQSLPCAELCQADSVLSESEKKEKNVCKIPYSDYWIYFFSHWIVFEFLSESVPCCARPMIVTTVATPSTNTSHTYMDFIGCTEIIYCYHVTKTRMWWHKKQESRSAWTQEAYRPPHSKCSLCWWRRGTPSSHGGGITPPPTIQTWDGVPPHHPDLEWGTPLPPTDLGLGTPLPPESWTDTHLWKHNLPSYVRTRAVKTFKIVKFRAIEKEGGGGSSMHIYPASSPYSDVVMF